MTKRRLELLTLLVGVAVTIACVSKNKGVPQPLNANPMDQNAHGLSLDIPDAGWEPAFFEALQERTKKAGMSSLRSIVLPDNDLEVRFWYDHFEIISGLIIRRKDEKWSATYLRQRYDSQPSSVQAESLEEPKSGWEAAWRRLTNAGILTLPDGSTTKCKSEVLDGISYVVETNLNRKYRTFRYGNPQLADCDEAKQIMSIEEILADEFSPPKSEN